MSKQKKGYSKQRKPMFALVLEGRNKTEKLYFEHFKTRNAPYILKLVPAGDTDPVGMADKAMQIYEENDMREENGDVVFCLVDLDLSFYKYEQVNAAKVKHHEVEFILSNPCFEVWLLYYYTEYPKKLSSSQKVKNELKRFVPRYNESFDIVKEEKLQNQCPIAMTRAEKGHNFIENENPVEKNPYTEVGYLIKKITSQKFTKKD